MQRSAWRRWMVMAAPLLGGVLAGPWLGSCGPAVPAATAGPTPAEAPPAAGALVPFVTPSRLVPELDLQSVEAVSEEQGQHRVLVAGLRVVVRDDGRVERGDQRFPPGSVRSVPLPPRLGEGFLFYQADSRGTRLWRADQWVSELSPVAQLSITADQVIVGLDRLFVRAQGSYQLIALDAASGRVVSWGQLPLAAGYGAMSFADGWRGVVDTELRGPMVSFDAGASWLPLPIESQLEGAGVEQGDPVLYTANGHYRVDLWGKLHAVQDAEPPASSGDGSPARAEASPTLRAHPLGKRALREAVLRGWPDSQTSAVVARRGALTRVELPSGAILGTTRGAFAEQDADCQGVRLGAGFGFVCGQPEGATVLYAFQPPLSVREIMRFAGPRFVSPSGNGALVVRGSCGDGDDGSADIRSYCIIGRDGASREIGVRGDLGAERVVALQDGRVVVLVPPRVGAQGRLTVIDGDRLASHELELPKGPRKAVALAQRGLWLEGFEQRGTSAIGGWIEAGGPVLGVQVRFDGTVKLGKLIERGGEVLLSGRFALAASETEGGIESTDGGKTWLELELPRLPDSPRDASTRGCSPVGCALRGWVRVGWGKPLHEGDLALAPTPKAAYGRSGTSRPLRLRCRLDGDLRSAGAGTGAGRSAGSTSGDWHAFLDTPAPGLRKDDEGVAKGSSSYEPVRSHVYVWGPKGADWTRAGWWSVRFDDRFDSSGRVRQSAPTRSPWGDRATAAHSIGARSRGGYWRWSARLDPEGRAALLSACRGARCRLYAVTDGRPILPLRDGAGRTDGFSAPLPQGAVRIGETWSFITESSPERLDLWRAELGVVEHVRSYRRLDRRRYGSSVPPRLVRRAFGRALGLLISVPADPGSGHSAGRWVVLPIDAVDGALGEPIALLRGDLGGVLPPPCGPQQDGWLLDGPLDTTVAVDLVDGRAQLDAVELRLRLEPGGGCVAGGAARSGRALSARTDSDGSRRPGRRSPPSPSSTLSIAVRQHDAPARWRLRCEDQQREPTAPLR